MSLYKRFWFEFDLKMGSDYPMSIGYGCGVTAFDYQDAINIIKDKVYEIVL